jgi:hypothetical protein
LQGLVIFGFVSLNFLLPFVGALGYECCLLFFDMNPLRHIANSRGIIRLRFVLLDARRQITFWLALGFAIVAADSRGQGFLIPDTTRRDMVFDFAGQNLYISTSPD